MDKDIVADPYLGENLIFIISAPRSGSTLLQRMMGSHSQVFTHPEPHILTPLAFQGVFYQVEKADYNHKVAATALSEFVEELPRGEDDYLDACREYCRVLYSRVLEGTGKRYFLDKTPNYADTILPFMQRLLPKAKYIVLTRHPLAIVCSSANTFYKGDFNRAFYSRNILADFVPPLASFLRDSSLDRLHVKYEEVVSNPEEMTARVLNFLGLDFEEGCINFGGQKHINKTYGDPKINNHHTPVTSSIYSWVDDLKLRPGQLRLYQKVVKSLSDEDLADFGYSRQQIWAPLEERANVAGVSVDTSVNGMLYRAKWACIWALKWVSGLKPVRRLLQRISHAVSVLLR